MGRRRGRPRRVRGGRARLPLTLAVQFSVRAAVAAGLAVAIAERLRLPFPIYSMIAAVIVTDLSSAQTRRLGVPRLAGTVIGGIVGAALISTLGPGPLAVVVGIMSAMLISHLLRLREAAKVAGYVSGVVLLEHGADPWLYAWLRLLETLLGIGIAILVAFLPKVLRTERDVR